MIRTVMGAVALTAAGLALAGCGGPPPAAASFTLTGDLQASCGSAGTEDITDGAAVTVYDAAGTTVAVGQLGKSRNLTEFGPCMWPITVPNVPGSSAFYAVEVTHRGKVTVPAANAKAGDVHLTLGDGLN